jgi:hypothetical protein
MQSKCFNIKYSLAIAWAILFGGLVSCDSNEDGANSQVVLESFGPSGVKHGESIKFIGRNLDKVTSIEFAGVTVEKGSFSSQSSGLIELIVPDATEEGTITLKTPDGDIPSKSILSFDVTVTIGSVQAEAKPGTTLTITGEYVNWITEVWFTDGVVADEFVSKSVNELVLVVPMEAQTGPLVFITGGTEPETIDSEQDLIVTLPGITSISPMTAERGEDLTITGTNLDLATGVLFKGSDVPVTTFISKSETQIVVTIPDYTNKGKVSVVAASGVAVESSDILTIPLPPLAPLGLAIFDDALQNGWQKWGGWGGGSSDLNNTDNVREGDKGIKVVFGGDWGGPMQLGSGNSSTTGFTKFVVSIFGTPGTGGKVVNLIVKGGSTEEKQITIVEGEWTEYEFLLSTTFGSPATITELFFQDRGWSGTLYVDHIGLR